MGRKTALTPLTIITGYLGSGKTTLVNRLLGESVSRIAVLVNEFGAVDIDGALIRGMVEDRSAGTKVIELANGCLCCVVTGEFRKALLALDPRVSELDQIIIETSGAADPTSVIKLFWGDPELTTRFRLDGVVCVVDAANDPKTREPDKVAALQTAVADVLILSKIDRVDEQAFALAHEAATRLNSGAEVIELNLEDRSIPIPREKILSVDAYRKPLPNLLRRADSRQSHGGLRSVAMSWDGVVDRAGVQEFFRSLVLTGKIVRVKALLRIAGEERHWLIQGVRNWVERSPAPKSYNGANRLVILGRELDDDAISAALERLKGREASFRS